MHTEMWEISFLVFIVTLSLAHAILYLKVFINIAFNYDGKDPVDVRILSIWIFRPFMQKISHKHFFPTLVIFSLHTSLSLLRNKREIKLLLLPCMKIYLNFYGLYFFVKLMKNVNKTHFNQWQLLFTPMVRSAWWGVFLSHTITAESKSALLFFFCGYFFGWSEINWNKLNSCYVVITNS